MSNEATLGTYAYERETKATYVFVRVTETGRKESQYVLKSAFEGERPDTIEVVIRY